jgi:hypothetical protein
MLDRVGLRALGVVLQGRIVGEPHRTEVVLNDARGRPGSSLPSVVQAVESSAVVVRCSLAGVCSAEVGRGGRSAVALMPCSHRGFDARPIPLRSRSGCASGAARPWVSGAGTAGLRVAVLTAAAIASLDSPRLGAVRVVEVFPDGRA